MRSTKDFKVAHVVPVSCLDYIANNHYHMCLAHLVGQNEVYADFYRKMSDRGKFVLMDNGAAENSQLDVDQLLEMYQRINPTEIVVPDTLLDGGDTIRKMDSFVNKHGDLPYRFMGVPQGQNLVEWIKCMEQIISFERVNTIGISKFLNIATHDPLARYYAASATRAVAASRGRDDIEIHLLGCDEGPAAVRCIQSLVPAVRGCDSAFAYIAANNKQSIDETTTRPKGEIDFLGGECPSGLLLRLYEMEDQCGAYRNADGEKWREIDGKF